MMIVSLEKYHPQEQLAKVNSQVNTIKTALMEVETEQDDLSYSLSDLFLA